MIEVEESIDDEEISVQPIYQYVVDAVGVAMCEHYRIERCSRCGGPEVFSKLKAISRCLRCGHIRQHLAVKQHKSSWRRCAACGEQRMAGVPLSHKFCRTCSALTRAERAKILRWRLERNKVPIETSIKPALE